MPSAARYPTGLTTTDDRAADERLLLHLAVGAATERVYLSYPRIELREARPRVPSFYGLDVMRAITGRVPSHEELQDAAARETKAALAWPAPDQPARAVDDFEHDLAVLGGLLRDARSAGGQGTRTLSPRLERAPAALAHGAVEALEAGVDRAGRPRRGDGDDQDGARRAAAGEPRVLAYRAPALRRRVRTSSCCRQSTGSQPFEEPTPLQRLDPLTKGALFHAIQTAFYRERAGGRSAAAHPREPGRQPRGARSRRVAGLRAARRTCSRPAVDRVWRDEIARAPQGPAPLGGAAGARPAMAGGPSGSS